MNASLSPAWKDRSLLARRRFEGCADRHRIAMATLPRARGLETAPFVFILPRSRRLLLDLFSGTGFATREIRSEFQASVLIDPYIIARETLREDACDLSAPVLDPFSDADLAVCLAGFHHVLGPGVTDERALHARERCRVLATWLSKLVSPGGRLIVADVPAPGTDFGWACGTTRLDLAAGGSRVSPLSNREPSVPGDATSLHGYLDQAITACCKHGLLETEPAAFFDDTVARLSPGGHEASFDTPSELAELFESAGFANVGAFVLPTPWIFRTRADALWFVHELLSIGSPCSSPAAMSVEERSPIEAGIGEHLALRELDDGSWAIAWKLMYVMGDRP